MDLRNIKLIITDMDGTLLDSKHQVSQQFLNQFEIIYRNNIKFVAASGRPFYSIKQKLNKIHSKIGIAGENGGVVYLGEEKIFTNPISKEEVKEITDVALEDNDIYPIFCTKERAYIYKPTNELLSIFEEYYPLNNVIESTNEIKEDILKIALYHKTDAEANIYPKVKHLDNKYKVKISGKNWVDIALKDTNKGNALDIILKETNIKYEEVLAFGDYHNDVEMLEKAGISVAMENAHDDVKKISKYETKSNDQNGVEDVIDELIRQKKIK